ncbi:MAG TPA: DUF4235 domain-containing protein [Mycobacteriales bacterium]|nr:DUF4235 domain-containing protein [Mycobacteriales bacterium]
MSGPIGKVGFKLIGIAISVPTGIIVRKTLHKAWVRSRGAEPPAKPKAPESDWLEAIAWTGVSSVVTVATQIATERGAAKAYRALTGLNAPGHDPKEIAEAKA